MITTYVRENRQQRAQNSNNNPNDMYETVGTVDDFYIPGIENYSLA